MNKTDRIAGRRGAGAANRLQFPTAPDSRDALAQVSIGAGAASGQYARYTASCTDLPVQRQRVRRVVGGQIFLLRNELLFGPFLLSPTRNSPDGVSRANRAVSGKTARFGVITGSIAPFGAAQMALGALFPGVYPSEALAKLANHSVLSISRFAGRATPQPPRADAPASEAIKMFSESKTVRFQSFAKGSSNLSLHALSGPGIFLEQDGPHGWAAQTGLNLQQHQMAAAQVSLGTGAASGQYGRYTVCCGDPRVQAGLVQRVLRCFVVGLLRPTHTSPDGVSRAKRAVSGKTARFGPLTSPIAPSWAAQMALGALFPGVYPSNLSLHALSGSRIFFEQDKPHCWAAWGRHHKPGSVCNCAR